METTETCWNVMAQMASPRPVDHASEDLCGYHKSKGSSPLSGILRHELVTLFKARFVHHIVQSSSTLCGRSAIILYNSIWVSSSGYG